MRQVWRSTGRYHRSLLYSSSTLSPAGGPCWLHLTWRAGTTITITMPVTTKATQVTVQKRQNSWHELTNQKKRAQGRTALLEANCEQIRTTMARLLLAVAAHLLAAAVAIIFQKGMHRVASFQH